MKKQISIELIREALRHLSPNVPRTEWARAGMAIKSEYSGDDGFTLFDEWSMRGDSYDAKAVRSTFKSIKPTGGVTIATLIHEAQANGFELPKLASDAPKPSAAQLAAHAAEKKAAAQRERERTETAQLATAAQAMKRWKAAQDAPLEGTATYPACKGVQAHGLRFEADGVALVPLRDGDSATGKLWNVQTLAPRKIEGQPDKLFLKGGRKAGLWHMLGMPDLEQKQPSPVKESAQLAIIFIAEGYATAASVHEATGLPVACAFDAGNMQAVAKALRALHTTALLVIAGDDDHETQATTGRNAGREAADKAAKAVKGIAALPSGLQAGESDWNDLHVRLGLDVVREQLMNAIESAARKGDSLSPFADDAQASDTASKTDKAPNEDKRFSVSESGVWFTGLDADGKLKSPLKLCSPLHVTAGTRDFEGNGFGCLLEFDDPLGHRKAWPMPARMLSGDGNEYRSVLLSMGLRIEPGSAVKNLLSTYIQSRQPTAWAHCTDRAGWHKITNNSEGKSRLCAAPPYLWRQLRASRGLPK
jgi:putative DNA primase/helicase